MAQDELAVRIVRAMRNRAHVISDGIGECELVYVRGCNTNGTKNANRPDYYDDLRVVLHRTSDGFETHRWRATTQPGPTLTNNPVAGARPKGAAILPPGQHPAVWIRDKHSGKYWAICQRLGPVTVARDKNKDMNPAGDETTTGMFGINHHHGSQTGPGDHRIGAHSAGCLVTPLISDHENFMDVMMSDPRYIKNNRHGWRTTILEYEWLNDPAEKLRMPLPSKESMTFWGSIAAIFAAVGAAFSGRPWLFGGLLLLAIVVSAAFWLAVKEGKEM